MDLNFIQKAIQRVNELKESPTGTKLMDKAREMGYKFGLKRPVKPPMNQKEFNESMDKLGGSVQVRAADSVNSTVKRLKKKYDGVIK